MQAARVRSRFLPAIDLLPSLGLIAVLGIGGHRVLDGQMTVGELVAFNFYVALLVWPLRTIGMTLAWGQRAAAALERVARSAGHGPRDPRSGSTHPPAGCVHQSAPSRSAT